MASSYLLLDTRAARQDGTYPLKLVIVHGTRVSINLKIYLAESQWSNGAVVNHPRKGAFNQIIKFKTAEVNALLFRLHHEGKLPRLTAKQVKALADHSEEKETAAVEEYTFQSGCAFFLKKVRNERTREIYESTVNKVAEFTDKRVLFSDITPTWLSIFENFMDGQGLCINARGVHFRNIRAVFNYLIDEKKISLDLYPFRHFKIKKQKTIKRSITVEQLRQIRDIRWASGIQEAADFFMLSFYLIGINIVDVLHLKELSGDKIIYYRRRTGRLYEFKVPPEALPIIERNRGKEYLLSWRERYTDYRGFTGIVNERCKEIGKVVGVPKLTTYYARHTWATIAGKLDIPKETIAASLGHGEETVTDIYIDFDVQKIDEANRQVIDYLFEDGEFSNSWEVNDGQVS